MLSGFHHILRVALGLTVLATVAADELPLRESSRVEDDLLVLTNGRVVSGRLMPRPGGYDVLQPVGRMFVPSQQVRFKATDLLDAHQKMRDSVQELTPETHLELARWCLANGLKQRARQELLDALHQDPYRADAKRMLEDIKRDERRAAVSTSAIAANFDPAMASNPELLPERRSLGGLPDELAAEFTRRIQPLLSNKCGNARCHGAGRNGFAVVLVRGQSTPAIAEQNLAGVLNQIDFESPNQSPLLNATVGLHGGSRKLLFPGRAGGAQVEVMRNWVTAAASSLRQNSPVLTAQHTEQHDSPIQQTAFNSSSSQPINEANTAEPMLTDRDRKFLKEADEAIRKDAFDPNIFNQRYHGPGAKSATGLTP